MAQEEHETLEPPARKKSIDDPGAHELESSDSDDHFSDAQSGLEATSGIATPAIPHTRVEKVDDEARYGEEPGTEAYKMREQDAAPDEIEVVPEGRRSASSLSMTNPTSPGGHPIPMTVVEKVDPSSPSYGEVPGTPAHDKRLADAIPDLVLKSGELSRSSSIRSRSGSTPGDRPIPKTKVERVDTKPAHGEVPGTKAYALRREDAKPDIVEEVEDVPGPQP